MKNRLFAGLATLALALGGGAPTQAQTVAFDHGGAATATGAGATGTPSLSFNVTAGQNRIVFITATFERDHCTTNTTEVSSTCVDETSANSNFASPAFGAMGGANVQIQFTVTGPGGSTTVTNPLVPPAGDLRFINIYATAAAASGADRTAYSQEIYFTALYESQLRILLGGADSGTLTITLPNVDAPNRAGDEALLSAMQFNHVSQLATGGPGTGIVRSGIDSATTNCGTGLIYLPGTNAPGNWSSCLNGYDAGQAPVNAGDGVLLVGINGYARSGPMDFATVPGFTEILNPAVINTDPSTTGVAGAHFLAATESDGFSTSFQFASGIPSANVTLQSQNGALTPAQSTSGGMSAKFTLTRALVDLSITKTNTPGINGNVDQVNDTVAPGSTTTYTLVVSNPSMNYADLATLIDPATTGLTKTAVACTATTGGAVCPSSGDVTVAALESAGGIAIPTLPPNSTMTFTVTATVAAGISPVTNTATIRVPDGYVDATPANNTATDTDGSVTQLTLRKISLGGVDSFGFSGSNGVATQTLTTITDGTPEAGVTQPLTATSTATTITENTSPATYRVTDITCTGLGAGGTATPDLAARTVALNAAATAPGSDIVCTFTNTLQQADIQVVKTASPDPVLSGGVVTYSIVASNNGPQAASNVLLTDVAGAGQDCTVPSTTATCTATDGASCPSPTVPVSSLLGAGITIPSLPVGGQVTVSLQCAVTATGL
ncbi:hypothetical protein [Pseudoxanthomonas sp. SE1]|uniref:prealbumin-like fold domain-containing protein n=1 Tax=Pseudoxanthomonas sp. SE1 TaxID=1664560 RepID=UPI00240E98CF|nr:hypothetical protein [Pseudoxanthomonas sp. SE1]WFC43314.1 hypothetical protein OY559_07370 [Pseudoxanthomonas sp. SE1]